MDQDRHELLLKLVRDARQGVAPENPLPDDPLARELADLGRACVAQRERLERMAGVLASVNRGLTLDQVVDRIFSDFDAILPFDRIGLALLDQDKVVSRAHRSRATAIRLGPGFTAPLAGSSLATVLETGKPRIINDLTAYLQAKPGSASTRLIVDEGMGSSLTCPLSVAGAAVGFLFFTSKNINTYKDLHTDLFLAIAEQVSAIIEKGRLYQRLLELDELKNRFLGIAAHDLRSPLSLARSHLGLLMDGYVGEISQKQRELMQRMDASLTGMTTLISDLLDISAIESGKLDLTPAPTDLAAYLENHAQAGALLASAKQITVRLDLQPHLPHINLDQKRMDQVLTNLLTNAIKFSMPQTTITLRALQEGSTVRIAVKDQGQGIPAEDLPKLFKAFSKTRTKPTAGEKSTGLGLHIVAKIVEAHGGHMEVSSHQGEGSTFTAVLPVG